MRQHVLAGVQGNPKSKQEVLGNGTSCPISIKMTELVKIPPSQGQTLALLRMIMALPQTNNFKANTQILANVDPVQKLGLFGNAEE